LKRNDHKPAPVIGNNQELLNKLEDGHETLIRNPDNNNDGKKNISDTSSSLRMTTNLPLSEAYDDDMKSLAETKFEERSTSRDQQLDRSHSNESIQKLEKIKIAPHENNQVQNEHMNGIDVELKTTNQNIVKNQKKNKHKHDKSEKQILDFTKENVIPNNDKNHSVKIQEKKKESDGKNNKKPKAKSLTKEKSNHLPIKGEDKKEKEPNTKMKVELSIDAKNNTTTINNNNNNNNLKTTTEKMAIKKENRQDRNKEKENTNVTSSISKHQRKGKHQSGNKTDQDTEKDNISSLKSIKTMKKKRKR